MMHHLKLLVLNPCSYCVSYE